MAKKGDAPICKEYQLVQFFERYIVVNYRNEIINVLYFLNSPRISVVHSLALPYSIEKSIRPWKHSRKQIILSKS